MSFSDVEHFANMVNGCESINNHLATRSELSSEGKYALTVLKLHANDAGFIAGQEGFTDNIKKGAKNAKEWILKFIKAIFDYLTGNKKKKQDLVKRTTEAVKVYNGLETEKKKEVSSTVANGFGDKLDRAIFEAESFVSASDSTVGKEIKYSGSPAKIVTELNAAKSNMDNPVEFSKHLNAASEQIDKEMHFWNSRLSEFMKGDSDRDHDRTASEATNVVKWLGKADTIVVSIQESLVTRWVKAVDTKANGNSSDKKD